MKQYTIYCTADQCKKAWKLGAPIDIEHEYDEFGNVDESSVITPTAEQMVGWLESKGIQVTLDSFDDKTWYSVVWRDLEQIKITDNANRKETLLSAIDSALLYLEKHL